MIPVNWLPFANHVWQSTLFAVAAVLLTLALRKNRAQARYSLWLAASLKFLIPFSLLLSVGRQVEWRAAPDVPRTVSVAVEQISQPFAVGQVLTPATPAEFSIVPALPAALWLGGCGIVLFGWWKGWRRICAAVRAASPLRLQTPIPVMSSPTLLEPGVFGIVRPVLLLPSGIADHLTPEQLDAILAHELCHVRRRDNLAAAIHMLVEAVFWFHPLVWWIGARMIEERERACDEEVLRMGSEPEVYAEGILNVCKFYLESPLPCASGVTGADLKKRIEAIMTNRISHKLTITRKLLLAAAGIAVVAVPVLIGIVNSPRVRAQSTASAAPLVFEVASVKPASPDAQGTQIRLVPGGGMNIVNGTLKQVIGFAYDVRDFQISGGPGWLNSERYDILAKPERPEGPAEIEGMRTLTEEQRKAFIDRIRERMRALLTDRFQLAVHKESKELPVYALVVGKNGPKLKESQGDGPQHMRTGRGQMNAEGSPIQMLATMLANVTGRTVLDQTGLKGRYDFTLEWTPEPGGPMGPGGPGGPGERPEATSAPSLSGASIFTAVQEQLGLKLEAKKGPVESIVIDRVEKASAN